jgi:hypothetical protein
MYAVVLGFVCSSPVFLCFVLCVQAHWVVFFCAGFAVRPSFVWSLRWFVRVVAVVFASVALGFVFFAPWFCDIAHTCSPKIDFVMKE